MDPLITSPITSSGIGGGGHMPPYAQHNHTYGGVTRMDEAMRLVTEGLQHLVQAMVVEQSRGWVSKSSEDLDTVWERIEQLETELEELQA